jgi:DMSO/TMAO reductase YedYZ molybdopterin-dependent catalytic subunit
VVIFPKNNPGQIRQLQDLAKPGLKFVTAAPEVPIGVYTQAMLDKMAQDPAYGADFKDRVNANIVSREPNVRQVVAKILLGEADAAVVYSSDVTPDVAPNLGTPEIPDQFNTLATYPIAIVRGAANRSGAEAFIAYVLSPPGQATLKKWGFITLSAPGPARPATPSESAATGPAAAPGLATQRGYADSFELVGLVDRPRRFTQADLQGYPAVTLTVAYGSGQGFEQGTFTGVRLWDLLQEAGIRVDPTRRNDRLRKYVVATGSDGYEAVFSLAELDPEFGAEVVLVAYRRDGQPLGPREGMARIVIGTDKRGGRLVSNLVRIEVRDIDSPPRSAGS